MLGFYRKNINIYVTRRDRRDIGKYNSSLLNITHSQPPEPSPNRPNTTWQTQDQLCMALAWIYFFFFFLLFPPIICSSICNRAFSLIASILAASFWSEMTLNTRIGSTNAAPTATYKHWWVVTLHSVALTMMISFFFLPGSSIGSPTAMDNVSTP